jgi:hypothetical protein
MFGRLRAVEGKQNVMVGEWGALRVVMSIFGLCFFLAFLASTIKWFDVASDLATIKTRVEYIGKQQEQQATSLR